MLLCVIVKTDCNRLMCHSCVMERTHKTDTDLPDLIRLLDDPHTVTVTVETARRLLGVARTTAIAAYQRTGNLIEGVPVIRVGRRCFVSTAHLRAALGRPAPSVTP